MFRQLDPGKIIQATRSVGEAVAGQYPKSGLAEVAREVTQVAEDAAVLSGRLARPYWFFRIGASVLVVGLLVLFMFAIYSLRVDPDVGNVSDVVQGIEALINDLVFACVAVWFAFSLETRAKRRRALDLIGELRSLSHVIDLHQMGKDPDVLHGSRGAAGEPDATALPLSPPAMARYLDYCSELLSLIAKQAALCVQHFDDPVTLAAVKELEDLTNGLSRKIWQKIMIIDRVSIPGAVKG